MGEAAVDYSRVIDTSLNRLMSSAQKSTNRSQRNTIKKAFLLAADAHKFQKRLSGEPYIIHPLEVANILAELALDHEVICAALLHDVIEDTNVSKSYLEEDFGEKITHLVDGVTKISKLKSQSAVSQQAENIRKMILATVRDPRVILIKLADKLHNMRTLGFHNGEKARRIAQEVIDIYAPIAGRLGIFKIKWELEDLALYHLDHEVYKEIKEKVAEKKDKRDDRIKVVSQILREKLKENKIKAQVEGRSKHFYSIYHKMVSRQKTFEEIFDLTGIRLLVKDQQDCYAAIGIVHTLWNPIPGRFKDYIAVPKSNGYQSLHTTIIGHDGKPLEIQIRTYKMHEIAEFGIAAHWHYKDGGKNGEEARPLKLLHSLADIDKHHGQDASLFMEELKGNLSGAEVYVFTPKGEIISMAKGSTILDFAFRIHTELGLKCAGAKIGERLVSIRTPVKSGDQVQIITNSTTKPSLNWLNFLHTSHARAKLRSYFRKKEIEFNETSVKKPSEQDDPATTSDKPRPNPRILPSKKANQPTVEWEGETDLNTKFAKCCAPLPGDDIKGFITKGQGISIHKSECPSLKSLQNNENTTDRVIDLRWSGIYHSFKVYISIIGRDRPQLYLDMVKTLAHAGANIIEARATTHSDHRIENIFAVEIDSLDHLKDILQRLRKIDGIFEANRVISPRKGHAAN